jgi:hypothetical protein
MSAFPNEFGHFTPLDERQEAAAASVLQQVKARMTDETLAALVREGVVSATADKERASAIVTGLLTAGKIATRIIGAF